MNWKHYWAGTLLAAVSLFSVAQPKQDELPPEVASDIVRKQLEIVNRSDTSLRYLVHKSDNHGTVVRDVIETPNGSVGRLISREGKPLTAEEDKAERDRLTASLGSASELRKKRKQEVSSRTLTTELVSVLPQAMLFTLHPGQPQLPNIISPQIVYDFSPNPAFHPASTAQQALTGLQGILWVDHSDHHVIRMEGTIIRNTNFAWGLIARIYAGGHLEFEQAPYAPGKYAYSKLVMNLSLRELMVKTIQVKSSMEASDFLMLPSTLSLDDAIHILLDEPRR
ncbi:hypothetical protein [Terriglobus saanensis]|uniref:Uncharacterized protein n=1 Tax=Terriglobus saanensis (strain ATCC BAA-1853 / DSM 23119 / SP1PR4) TaxID=401053 RepID=E8V0U5_TERSS|nr:hypothetical protein [Terriglobus saanensis]ADV82236.1 hypothetical protein AciPR4_1413 [Terriglobus saanensis SP1PR4]